MDAATLHASPDYPVPPDESLRLDALARSGLTEGYRDPALQAIAQAAAAIAGTPMALVTLVAEERQWFAANVGMEGVDSTPREVAFCCHTILDAAPFIVGDARQDVRFSHNPLVSEGPRVAFYAGFPLRDDAGHGLGALCVLDRRPRDLSPRQAAALEALAGAAMTLIRRIGEERGLRALRAFVEASDSELFICDAGDLRLVDANAAGLRRVSDSAAIARQLLPQLALHELQDWMPPDAFRDLMFAASANGRAQALEVRQTRPNPADLLAWLVPYRSDGVDLLGVGLLEVTRWREAARAAASELERWKLAIDASGDGLWDWNVASGAVVYSSAWARLLGLAEDAPPCDYQAWVSRIHPDDAAQAREDMARCFRGETGAYRSEHRLRGADGGYRWMLCRGGIASRADDGRPSRVVGTMKDSSAWHALRDSLDAARDSLASEVRARTLELEAANQDLRLFSAAAAHDLAAPLRTIDGFLRLLAENHGASFHEDARKLLDRAQAGAERLQRLFDALTVFFRAGTRELVRSRVDVDAVARRALESCLAGPHAARAQVEFGALPPCLGDEALIQIVFANLIGNALKFSRERDRPTVEIGSANDGTGPVYFVRDNGVGFDPAAFPGLFKPFQRLHSTMRFDGSGIGLATVSRIVARGGGRIWVESAPERGATFHFHFEPRASIPFGDRP